MRAVRTYRKFAVPVDARACVYVTHVFMYMHACLDTDSVHACICAHAQVEYELEAGNISALTETAKALHEVFLHA